MVGGNPNFNQSIPLERFDQYTRVKQLMELKGKPIKDKSAVGRYGEVDCYEYKGLRVFVYLHGELGNQRADYSVDVFSETDTSASLDIIRLKRLEQSLI